MSVVVVLWYLLQSRDSPSCSTSVSWRVTAATVVKCWVCVVYLILHYGHTHATLLPYPCHALLCDNGAPCDASTGACDCTGLTHPNYQCEDAVATGGDGATCSGCEVSHTVGGADSCDPHDLSQCLCTEGYTGATCTQQRAHGSCSTSGVLVVLHPYSTAGTDAGFHGNIYISTDATFSDISGIPSGCAALGVSTINVDVAYDGSGTCDVTVALEGDGTSYKVYAYIQHNPDYYTQADQIIAFTCQASDTAADAQLQTMYATSVSSSRTPIETTYSVGATGVTMAVQLDNNHPITAPLSVGDDIAVIIQHTSPFTVRSCTAQDSASSPTSTLTLLDSWCVSSTAMSLFRGALVYASGTDLMSHGGSATSGYLIRLNLDTWYFLGSSSNNLFISCTVCFSCSPSSPVTCSNSYSSFSLQSTGVSGGTRRRRRVVPVHSSTHSTGIDTLRRSKRQTANETTLTVSVVVKDGRFTHDSGEDRAKDADDNVSIQNTLDTGADTKSCSTCFSSNLILLIVIILSCILITALFVTIYAFTKAIRATKRLPVGSYTSQDTYT